MSNIFKRIVGPLHLIVISLLFLSSVILNLKYLVKLQGFKYFNRKEAG